MNKSKNKGKQFERVISKIFSDGLNEQFVRVPNSGSFVGGNNKASIIVSENGQVIRYFRGDIIPPKKYERLILECKKREKIDIYSILTGNISVLKSWIEQLYNDYQDNENFIRLLVISANSRKPLVIYDKEYNLNTNNQPIIITKIIFNVNFLNNFRNIEKIFIITELTKEFLENNKNKFI